MTEKIIIKQWRKIFDTSTLLVFMLFWSARMWVVEFHLDKVLSKVAQKCKGFSIF